MVYGIDKKTNLPYLLAHFNDTFYKLCAESDCVKIQYYSDKNIDICSHTYEVAMLFPVSKDADLGHLDMLVVLDKDKHIVACLDNADWIVAFIQGENDSDYFEVYSDMFYDIIKQINFGGVYYVGK